jgi:hypothetical protein
MMEALAMTEPSVEEMVEAYECGVFDRRLIPALVASWRRRGETLEEALDELDSGCCCDTCVRIRNRARAALKDKP